MSLIKAYKLLYFYSTLLCMNAVETIDVNITDRFKGSRDLIQSHSASNCTLKVASSTSKLEILQYCAFWFLGKTFDAKISTVAAVQLIE